MPDQMSELERIRALMKNKGRNNRDPNEWRPDKAEPGAELKWKFFILPPVESMSLWYYRHGYHYIEQRSYECPRLHDDMACPLCQYAFDSMKNKSREERSAIARALLPSERYAVNIYFPAYESTPQELRGKVLWWSMPGSVFSICEQVIFRDGPGEGPEPEPHGLFFDPANAHALILIARRKGDYNNYDATRFSATKTPITSKGEEAIKAILAQRHDIPSKFAARNIDALQQIVDKLSGVTTSIPAPQQKPQPQAQPQSKVDVESEVEVEPEVELEVPTAASTPLQVEEKDLEVPTAPEETNKSVESSIEDDPDLKDLISKLQS